MKTSLNRSQNTHTPDAFGSGFESPESMGQTLTPPAFQLQASPDTMPTGEGVIQGQFIGVNRWMQEIDLSTVKSLVAAPTYHYWEYVHKSGRDLSMAPTKPGQSPGFSANAWAVFLPKEWYQALQKYLKTGTKTAELGRALSGLTHELSHFHDRVALKEKVYPKSTEKDKHLTAVLKTEFKAWYREAAAAIMQYREKGIPICADDRKLIRGWTALVSKLTVSTRVDKMSEDNAIVGRTKRYYNENKKSGDSTLGALLQNSGNGLIGQLKTYSSNIKKLLDRAGFGAQEAIRQSTTLESAPEKTKSKVKDDGDWFSSFGSMTSMTSMTSTGATVRKAGLVHSKSMAYSPQTSKEKDKSTDKGTQKETIADVANDGFMDFLDFGTTPSPDTESKETESKETETPDTETNEYGLGAETMDLLDMGGFN